MKNMNKIVLSSLVLGMGLSLTACGGGSGDSSSNKKTEEFSAILPADSQNNISGQTGFVDVIMEIPRGSLSAGKTSSKDYKKACSDLANGFNKTYKDIYKKAQVSSVWITDSKGSKKQTLKPVLSHAIDADNVNRCVLQLGAGLVLRSQTESRKDETYNEILKTPQPVGIKYSKGSIKLEDGKFELIGVVNFDKEHKKIKFSQASNVNEISYNFYEKKGSKYTYNHDKSGTLVNGTQGVQFKNNQPATKEGTTKPADVSGIFYPRKQPDNTALLIKHNELKLTLNDNSTLTVVGRIIDINVAHLYGLKASATDATWTDDVDNTYFNYSFGDLQYSIKTLDN